ncbi:uncharacterized protein LOC121548221 [Coregonus clupeaformis]|uniref:uncharacterized protein LOC121548221 n=1 Tax=Coregonus clupeaformis TaxID=59861 RepID=UPI001E1C3A02|nr:uncharacterized protein LOC121548221 [Coregonus clupeaformis]XP_041715558.2 uncharacterized protein LOC121548221 [Coregonus clupeaformis]XP_045072110.1 uncharacterized protein LOC121548221 [Coregonus clupeaformis]XP_045072111.1 uncharacterized protein LOC121548221 [Coregonus clupeaformis]XP_045072112.1 uncharacterized protein LOC121548221 [Coregonus clupeaformis]
MLEIHDFANEVCASSKEIVVSVIKHYFHLDLENEKLLRSENIGNRLKRLPKLKDMKEKLLNEPFTFTSPVQKPCQKTAAKGTTRPNASLVSKYQSLKEISERRQLDVKKRKEEKTAKMAANEKEEPAKTFPKPQTTCQVKEPWSMKSVPEIPTRAGLYRQHAISTKSHSALMKKLRKCNVTQCTDEKSKFRQIKVPADIYPQEESDHHSELTEQASEPEDSQVDMFRKMILDVVMSDEVDQRKIFTKLIICVGDPADPERKFKQILTEYRSEILPHMVEQYHAYSDAEKVMLSLVNELFCGLHLIDGLAHQAKTTLLLWEKQIFGDKEVRCSSSFGTTELESGTVRLVRSVCDAVQAKGRANDDRFVKFKTFLTGKGEFDEVPLVPFRGNRLDTLCHNAAGVYSIHDDLVEFTSDYIVDSSLIKGVAVDLEVPQFKAGFRALGLISKIIIYPLWRALTLKGNILKMEARYQTLVTKLKEWQEDGRDVVEVNVRLFDDIEVPKDLVFDRLTMWTDTDFYELTVQIVELLLASCLRVCGKMLSSNPDHCRYVLPTDELRVKLRSMPKKDASLQRDVGLLEHLQRAKSGAIGITLEAMVMFKGSRTWDWLQSLDREKRMSVLKAFQHAVKQQNVLAMECSSVQNVKGNRTKAVVKPGHAATEEQPKRTDQNIEGMTVKSEMDSGLENEVARPQQSALQVRPQQSALQVRPQQSALQVRPQQSALQVTPQQSALQVRPQQSALQVRPQQSALQVRPQQSALQVRPQQSALQVRPQQSALQVRPQQSAQRGKVRVLLKRLVVDKQKAMVHEQHHPGGHYAMMKHDLIRELEKCGGLWEKENDMDEQLALLDEDERYSAVICQLQFRKYVLCMRNEKGLLNNSVAGIKLSFEELVTNLRSFISKKTIPLKKSKPPV